jgi:hypothetical protein
MSETEMALWKEISRLNLDLGFAKGLLIGMLAQDMIPAHIEDEVTKFVERSTESAKC